MSGIKNVNRIFLYALATLPLLSMVMVHIAIIFFVVGGILSFKEKDILVLNTKDKLKGIFWISLPFLMYSIGLLWSLDISSDLSFVARSYVFLLFPLVVFYGQAYNRQNIKIFIQVYIWCSFIFSCLICLYLIYSFFTGEINFVNSDYFSVLQLRTKIDTIPIIHEHPIYLSLMLGMALIVLYFNRFRKRRTNYIITIILLGTLLLASSRGPILALIIVFCGVIIQANKNKVKAISFLLLFLISVVGTVYFSPLNSRIKEITTTKHFYPQGIHHNSYNIRNGIYKCAYEIAEETPIYGYGGGRVQSLLNTCFINNFNSDVYIKRNYNTHNQYFHFYISFGLLGFILIMFSFALFFRRAFLVQDYSYIYFLIFFLICFLTENIINRNTGIVLFSIFNSLFYFRTYLVNDNS